jgi:hypothetical protein
MNAREDDGGPVWEGNDDSEGTISDASEGMTSGDSEQQKSRLRSGVQSEPDQEEVDLIARFNKAAEALRTWGGLAAKTLRQWRKDVKVRL